MTDQFQGVPGICGEKWQDENLRFASAFEEKSEGARRSASDLMWVAGFVVLFLVQLAHHEMWRDELNAFGIARASHTLSSLFWHLHFEGHPWLWYFLLWIVTKFTTSVVGMKILQAIIGISIYLLIGLSSPFSRVEKILLFLSYFISFEYTVVSRMYGVVLLLLLIYIRQRVLHPGRVLSGALLLGLMASTDMMGILLSGPLFVEYCFSMGTAEDKSSTANWRRLVFASAIYLGLTMLSLRSLVPASDVSWRTTEHPFTYAGSFGHLQQVMVRSIVMPYFPELQPGSFWNAVHTRHGPLLLLAPLVPVFLAAYYAIFRAHRNLLLFVGLSLLNSIAFGHLIYMGSLHHYGITFLAFLAALWVLRSRTARLSWIAYGFLGLSTIGGLYAGICAWQRPFSNSRATARWLTTNYLDTAPLVGSPDTSVVTVAEALNRPIYMLDCACTDTYVLFSRRRDSFDYRTQVPERLEAAVRALRVPSFVYLSIAPFSPEEKSALLNRGLIVNGPLASFTGAEVDCEDFYVYRINATEADHSRAE